MTSTCPKCNGTGKRELSPGLNAAAQAVSRLGTPTIAEIYAVLPDRKRISITAVNRRVERLVTLNVLKRVANSQPPRYQIAQ
jgi:hypothetical protein